MAEETATSEQTQKRIGKSFYVLLSQAGPKRDLSKGTREQPFWNEHAAFIDPLVDEGFITLGGPLEEEGGAVLVVRADSEEDVRQKMSADPWYRNGILTLDSVKRWTIFIDQVS